MNPKQAYCSLKSSSFGTKFITLFLFLQVAILLFKNVSVTIPHYFANSLISELIFHSDVDAEISKLKVSFGGKISFDKIKIEDSSGISLKIKRGNLDLNIIDLLNSSFLPLNSIELNEIEVGSVHEETNFLEFKFIKSNFRNDSVYLNIQSSIAHNSIGARGILPLSYFKDSKSKEFNLSNFLKESGILLKNVHGKSLEFSLENCIIVSNISDSSKFFLTIESNAEYQLPSKYRIKDSVINLDTDQSLSRILIKGKTDESQFIIPNQSFSVFNITNELVIEKFNQAFQISYNDCSVKSSTLTGKLTGSLRPFKLVYNSDNLCNTIRFISTTKAINSSLTYCSEKNQNFIQGFIKIKPNHLKLDFVREEENYNVFSGETLNFTFNKNTANISGKYPTSFKVNAKGFSALEAPIGDFEFMGEIGNDLSVEIKTARGKLGKSVVEGSYSQSWNPHAYEFRLKGSCHPPDINNWFNNWWKSIWSDFSFSENIPMGDFKISGIWGGKPGNSNTYGIIDSKELSYKGFKTGNSKVKIKVDQNSTLIISDSISHSQGKISGYLEFPRKLKKSPIQLKFFLDGIYPLNEARSIFGKKFEESITDINASSMRCNAVGEVFNQTPDQKNKSNFSLQFQTQEPIFYKGIMVSDSEGQIKKNDLLTSGSLPRFKIADGSGQMNFELDSNGSEETIKFNFSLKKANNRLIVEQFIKAKEKGFFTDHTDKDQNPEPKSTFKVDSGSLTISLQAQGPLNNPLQFEGTGMMQLEETKLGQINLLGGLSKGLSNLKIPLPTGALSFNELILPFELNNESIIFDKLTLNGPLSKITADGNLNLGTGTLDMIAKLNLVGNLPLPLIKNLVQFADPLSRMTEIKITGDYKNPKWEILLSTQ